jgi:hypothetical protein
MSYSVSVIDSSSIIRDCLATFYFKHVSGIRGLIGDLDVATSLRFPTQDMA